MRDFEATFPSAECLADWKRELSQGMKVSKAERSRIESKRSRPKGLSFWILPDSRFSENSCMHPISFCISPFCLDQSTIVLSSNTSLCSNVSPGPKCSPLLHQSHPITLCGKLLHYLMFFVLSLKTAFSFKCKAEFVLPFALNWVEQDHRNVRTTSPLRLWDRRFIDIDLRAASRRIEPHCS